MAHVSSIKLSDEEKLAMLQRLDQFRHWHSLDEKRYCLVCGEIITGPANPSDHGHTWKKVAAHHLPDKIL